MQAHLAEGLILYLLLHILINLCRSLKFNRKAASMARSCQSVVKIGGSLLSEPNCYKRVANEIISLRRFPIVIVVSAMARTTNRLLKIIEASGIHSKKHIDAILSFGEIISAKLMNFTFTSNEIKSVDITPLDRKWPIITNDEFGKATPNMRITQEKVQKVVSNCIMEHDAIVISGFVGRDRDGNFTTLGRGGSDISAVLIGHCINSEVVILKRHFAVQTLIQSISNMGEVKDTMTVDEFKSFLTAYPGFICDKALKYMGPKDVLRISSLDNIFNGTIISFTPNSQSAMSRTSL